MLFALIDGKKVEPIPNTSARCPFCNNTVIAKCGEIKVWHWAHSKGEICDPWYETETIWHKNWKLTFGIANCEIKIKKDDTCHVADIYTKNNVVIELQNSPIQKDVIQKRELFYGDRMIWLINGINFKNNFHIKDLENDTSWWGLLHNNCKNQNGIKVFNWEYPKKSWEDSKKNIFIDFHDESLFWIQKGMGSKLGKGKFVSKSKFISKYGGCYKTHLTLFRNKTLKINRSNLRLKGIEEMNMHLTTSIYYEGKSRTIEIYFINDNDIFKVKEYPEIIVNGALNFENESKNLQLLYSRIIEK
jgi:competence protein CoiA